MHRQCRRLGGVLELPKPNLGAVAPRRLQLVEHYRNRSLTCAFADTVRNQFVSRTLFSQTQLATLSEQLPMTDLVRQNGSDSQWRDLVQICCSEADDTVALSTNASLRGDGAFDLTSFAQALRCVRKRRADVLPTLVSIASSISEYATSVHRATDGVRLVGAGSKEGGPSGRIAPDEIYSVWVHHFLINRIVAHLVVDDFLQLVSSAEPTEDVTPPSSTAHIIEPACDVCLLVDATAADVCEACVAALGTSPTIEVVSTSVPPPNCAVPAQIQYVVMELLKNACVATVERGNVHDNVLVSISYHDNSTDAHSEKLVCIDITDAAGGIPPEMLRRVWQFGWSSRSHLDRRMAGCGVGLPLARVYASLFGGQLFVHPRMTENDQLLGSVFSLRLPWGALETSL